MYKGIDVAVKSYHVGVQMSNVQLESSVIDQLGHPGKYCVLIRIRVIRLTALFSYADTYFDNRNERLVVTFPI